MAPDVKWSIELVVSLLTAGAAVYIAFVAHKFSKRQSALSAVAQLSKVVAPLDRRLTKVLPRDEIIDREQAKKLVDSTHAADLIEFLNAYEEFSLAVLGRVVDERIAIKLRRESLIGTSRRFQPFIEAWREKYNRTEAWQNLENLGKRWSRHKQRLHQTGE